MEHPSRAHQAPLTTTHHPLLLAQLAHPMGSYQCIPMVVLLRRLDTYHCTSTKTLPPYRQMPISRKGRGSTLVPDSMNSVIQSYNTVAEVGHPQFAIYYDDDAMTEPEKMRQLICGAIDKTKGELPPEWPEFCLLHINKGHFDAMTRQYVTAAWFGIKIPDEHSKSNTSLF